MPVLRMARMALGAMAMGAMAMGATTYDWVLHHEDLLEHPERRRCCPAGSRACD